VCGYETLLQRSDIDAVYIPLPTSLNYEWSSKALESGKHVFVEKSITDHSTKAEHLVRLSVKNQVVVMENFAFLYHSQMNTVQVYVDSGEIGEIRLFRSSFGFPPFLDKTNIRYSKELGGGSLLDAGAYALRATQAFLGSSIEVLSASLLISPEHGVDIQGSAMLRSRDNIVSQIAFGFDNFYQNNIELWGTKGKIVVERAFTAQPEFRPKLVIEKQNKKLELSLAVDNQFKNILQAFYRSIIDRTHVDLHEELLIQSRLLTQVRQHAEEI
jgi:predicted dehydrogenase